MIKCNNCGYENNDGSQVCLNCRATLTRANRFPSTSEYYIRTSQKAAAAAERHVRNDIKKILIVFVIIALVFVIGVKYISTRLSLTIDF